jgi:hypothetical protein
MIGLDAGGGRGAGGAGAVYVEATMLLLQA